MKGCRSCNHWKNLEVDLDRIDPATAGKPAQLGACRRHAPRPGVSAAPDPGSLETMPWPRVASDDWCGDWEPNFQ
jgi:hypothetical protein